MEGESRTGDALNNLAACFPELKYYGHPKKNPLTARPFVEYKRTVVLKHFNQTKAKRQNEIGQRD